METKQLKLPIGIQTFETLRTEGYVYIDKTKTLVDLIDTGQIYFLARPRRFGKSLTISTFDALFSGKKELFKGLYAETFLNRPNFKPSPIIRLDMSKVTADGGIDELKESIKLKMELMAEGLEVGLVTRNSASDMFNELIFKLVKKHKQKVVILIDEYDKPYTDFVNDSDRAEEIREVLRSFYVQIKANDEFIRFTFITGISKFAKFGVFSTLNTPIDISMTPEYAEICGYSEEEILRYFPCYIEDTAKSMHISTKELIEKMRYYYNGFSFDRDAVTKLYNPFSTLCFFKEKFFYNFWIDTGKPKLIADYMKNRNLTMEEFRNLPVSRDFIKNPGELDDTPPEGFLYQSGYLTLRPGNSDELSLDYPNTEVLNAMSALVTQNIFIKKDESYSQCRTELLKGLLSKDKDKIIRSFNRLLTSIPYDDFSAAAKQSISNQDYEMQPQEWLYRASIFSFLQGCGVVVATEMHTNKGRPDLVITYKGTIWVIEIKVAYNGEDAQKRAKEAYQQIILKNYAAPYPQANCLGLGIDDNLRQITGSYNR